MTGNIFLLPLTFLVFLRSSALSPEQYTFSLWRVIPRSHKIAQCWDAGEPLAFLLLLWISVSLLWTVSVPGKMKKENVLVFFFTIIYASTSIEYKETVLVSLSLWLSLPTSFLYILLPTSQTSIFSKWSQIIVLHVFWGIFSPVLFS